MKPFHYCPTCATRLENDEAGAGTVCPECGRNWYPNASPTVGGVIVDGGRALISKRGSEPEKDRWDVPGGFLEPGEEALGGLRRELKEELGVEVDVSNDDFIQTAIHAYGDDGDFNLAIGFSARIVSGEPTANDDVAELKWVSSDEIDDIDFAWEHDRELVRKVLSQQGGSE